MNVLIRADASTKIGSGHIMRTLSIAEELKICGHNVTYCCHSILPELSQKIKKIGCCFEKINSEISSSSDKQETIKIAQRLNISCVVIDGYDFTEEYITFINTHCKVVLIDDIATLKQYSADIIINSSPFASPKLYHNRSTNSELLLGAEYALIRNEFRAKVEDIRDIDARNHILITFGGTDPSNLTESVLRSLLPKINKDRIVDVIVRGSLSEIFPNNVVVHQNCDYMADLMLEASIAISAGGSTLGELALMQVPTILVLVADNQEKHAKWANENKVNLVYDARKKGNEIGEDVSLLAMELLNNIDQRISFIERSKEKLDGSGVVRVVHSMLHDN